MKSENLQKKSYGVIGNPVQHSRSPWIHAQFARMNDHAVAYQAYELPLCENTAIFKTALLQLKNQNNLNGCNVTIPFKTLAFAISDKVSERASLAGAANVLIFQNDGQIHADNTDGIGLIHDLQQWARYDLKHKHILLIGAGGAASGVLAPLLQTQPQVLCITNRTVAKAQNLVQNHRAFSQKYDARLLAQNLTLFQKPRASAVYEIADDDKTLLQNIQFDLVINASSSSLQGGTITIDPSWLSSNALVYDMMYGAQLTAFLQWAKNTLPASVQVRDGLGMLVAQAAFSYQIWQNVRFEAYPVFEQLRQHIQSQ